MKALLLTIITLCSSVTFAGYDRIAMPYWIATDTINPKLPANQAVVTFQIVNAEFRNPDFSTVVKTAVNGVWKDVRLDKDNRFQFQVEPGAVEFQFYVNNVYREISVPEMQVEPQHDLLIGLNFMAVLYPEIQIEVKKPVVYLSSNKEIEFALNVLAKGDFVFTYPDISKGWKGKTNGDGSVNVNGENYPYLFWESEQTYIFQSVNNGYRVKKEDVLSFLEKRCDELGLTANQKADFITFWGPQMLEYDELFVQFHLNEACDQFATLDIAPKPDHTNRVYIAIAPWSNVFNEFINEVSLPEFSANGFTLTEWGGFTFEYQNDIVFKHKTP